MSRPRLLLILATLALIAGAVPGLAAQTGAETAPQAKPGDTVVFQATQPDGMPFTEFIDWVANHVERPFTYTPAARQSTGSPGRRIKFDRPVRLPRSEVLRFGRKVLFPHKLAIVEMGEGPTSHYLVESLDTPSVIHSMRRIVTQEQLADLREDYVLVACTVRLENVAVQQIQTQIQRMAIQATVYGSAIVPMPSENAFIIVDFAPTAHGLVELVRAMDVKAKRPPLPLVINTQQITKEIATLKRRVAKLEADAQR